ncbi:MAG: hypothetical protein CMD56_00065 [Gammaproteobacteria bacterium]|nr:hypothetical protein [Gammaproteobacteria bacterium]
MIRVNVETIDYLVSVRNRLPPVESNRATSKVQIPWIESYRHRRRQCDSAALAKSPVSWIFCNGVHYGLGKRADREISVDGGELDGLITWNADCLDAAVG